MSFGFEEWKKGFTDKKVTFKSVTPVPGTYVLRVYNGDAAVKFAILDVVFNTSEGELSLRVIRSETYIKDKGKWYFVSGQGTLVMSEEQKKKMAEPATK